MGKRCDPREKITQRSIGFNHRQIEFFDRYPDFKPDKFCREIIDNQIKLVDPIFLKKDDNTT